MFSIEGQFLTSRMSKFGEFRQELKRIFDAMNSPGPAQVESKPKTAKSRQDRNPKKNDQKKTSKNKPKTNKKKATKPAPVEKPTESIPAEDINASIITRNFALFIAEKDCVFALSNLKKAKYFKIWKSNLRKLLIYKMRAIKQNKNTQQPKKSEKVQQKSNQNTTKTNQIPQNNQNQPAKKTAKQEQYSKNQNDYKTPKPRVQRIQPIIADKPEEFDETVNFLIQAYNKTCYISESTSSLSPISINDDNIEYTPNSNVDTYSFSTIDTINGHVSSPKDATTQSDSAPQFIYEDSSSNIKISEPLHFDSSQINSYSPERNKAPSNSPKFYSTTPESQKSSQKSENSPIVKEIFSPTQRKSRVDELKEIIEEEKAKQKQEKLNNKESEDEYIEEEEEMLEEEEEKLNLITSSISTEDLSSEEADQSMTQPSQQQESDKLYDTDDITFTELVTDDISTSEFRVANNESEKTSEYQSREQIEEESESENQNNEDVIEKTVDIKRVENEEEEYDDSFSFTSSGDEKIETENVISSEPPPPAKKASKFIDPVLCKGSTMEQFALDDSGFTNGYEVDEEEEKVEILKKEKPKSDSDTKKAYESTSDDFVPNLNNFIKPKSHHEKNQKPDEEEKQTEEESVDDSFEITFSSDEEEEDDGLF